MERRRSRVATAAVAIVAFSATIGAADRIAPAAPQAADREAREVIDLSVAVTPATGGQAVALLTGSVRDESLGGAELTLLHPNRHVGVAPLALDDEGRGTYANGSTRLDIEMRGDEVTGTGTMELDHRSTEVRLHGVATDRSTGSGKVMLTTGRPSGPDQAAVAAKFTSRQADDDTTVEKLLSDPDRFAGLAVYAVGRRDRDLADDPLAALFLQSGRWVIVDAPDDQARADLYPLVHYGDPSDHSPQIALRLMDPGGSWNTRTLVVGYPTETQQRRTAEAPSSRRSGRSYRERLTAWEQRDRESASDGVESAPTRGRSVSIANSSAQGDGAGSGAFEPPDLPANSFGLVVTVDESPTYQLTENGGYQDAVNEGTCTSGYFMSSQANWQTCPSDLSQTADYSGTDNWYALLQVVGDGENGQALSMQWQLIYAQDITVNGSTTGALASNGVANGTLNYATGGSWAAAASCSAGTGAADAFTFGLASDAISCPNPFVATPMIETAWPLGNVTTNFTVTGEPTNTTPFAFLNQSSAPNNQITTVDGSQTVGGSWSVSGSAGLFGGQGIAQLSGSYSHDWSTTVDTTISDWTVTPLYNGGSNVQANVSWSTSSPVAWSALTGGSNNGFGTNPLNISGLDTDSTAAWQSACMFGDVSTSLVRQVQFGDTYTTFNAYTNDLDDNSETPTWTTTQTPVVDFNSPNVTLSGNLIQKHGPPQGCPDYPTSDQDQDS